MTIAELYQTALEELAALEAARSRLLGRADVLAELCAAGLRDTVVPDVPSPDDDEGVPLAPPASRLPPPS